MKQNSYLAVGESENGCGMSYYIAYGVSDAIIWGVFARNTDDARRLISDELKAYGYNDLLEDWTMAGRNVHLEERSAAA